MSRDNTQPNGTKQKGAFSSVSEGHNPFKSGPAGFALRTAASAMIKQPHAGNALGPVRAAGNEHIAQEIITTEKVVVAMHLEETALIQSVAGITHTAQVGRALTQSIDDEELRVFMNEYLKNGINFLTIRHAQHLEQLCDRLEEIIDKEVKPSWRHRAFG